MPARRHLPPSLAVVAVVCTAFAAPAQQTNNSGFGGLYRKIDLQALTGNLTCLGCADVNGELYVTARDPAGAGNHVVYVIDTTGAIVRTLNQPASHATTVFGMRDLCTDGAFIAGGSEAGISILQPDGTPATTFGGHPVTQPITGPVLAALGVPRGLAWDGNAAGGAGRFYAVNFESAIYEFDLSGTITGTFANRGWSGTGLALDPTTGNLWIDAAPVRGDIAEIDRSGGTWALTGHTIPQVRVGSYGGGLSEASGAAGVHAPWATQFSLVSIAQGQPDLLAVQRVHYLPTRSGWNDLRLEVGVNSSPLDTTGKDYGALDTLTMRVTDPTTGKNGQPCWTILNFMPESLVDALTDLSPYVPGLGLLDEHRTRHFANVGLPPANYLILGYTIGGIGTVTLPPGWNVAPGDVIRGQSIWLDPQNPQVFSSTNESWWVGNTAQVGVLVEAFGPTNFKKDPSHGFWRVTHLGGTYGPIDSVSLDWTTSQVPGQSTAVFDIDQDRMGDRHDGGNATATGCHGTYRNGSDTACGLDYAWPGNNAAPCGGGANSGFTVDAGTPQAAGKLTYHFAGGQFSAGKTFEFDCDTDGGIGVSGDAMQGLVVTVSIGGTLFTGALAVDPYRPFRAFVRL